MTNKTIDVYSENRTGITYQILSVFAENAIDLIGVEMITNHTFIKYREVVEEVTYENLVSQLIAIAGVNQIVQIARLPSEESNLHLNAILSHLPEPLIDIDEAGRILKVNRAALSYLQISESNLLKTNISELFNHPLERILSANGSQLEVTINDSTFFVEVTPIYHREGAKSSGAIVVLKPSEELGLTLASMQENQFKIGQAIVASSAMKAVFSAAEKFSRLELPILISGETGTGKELVAKYIHENSARKDKPFLALNCAALPENLLESELFGYEAGAFSGALKKGKPGLLELANKGTLFLDEVGEMSIYLQAKLLRFLQDYTFRRVGGQEERTVNVRVISATHRALSEQADRNQFRHDLFYRLNVLSLNIPPLRERIQDIKPLAVHFAENAGIQVRGEPSRLTKSAMMQLVEHQWPGNVRQLQNLVFRSVAMASGTKVDLTDLCFDDSSSESSVSTFREGEVESLKQALNHFEEDLLRKLYPRYPSTRLLAKRLRVSHNTIALKLRKLNINLT